MSTVHSFCRSPLAFLRLMIFAVFVFGDTAVVAEDFPKLNQQIDSTSHPVGGGTCATQRTGAWLADGGIVIEIQRPKQQCRFYILHLVLDGERIPLAAVDGNFYRGKQWVNNGVTQEMMYEWTEDSGKLFFRTQREIDPSKIHGILEIYCKGSDCLNEAAAVQAEAAAAQAWLNCTNVQPQNSLVGSWQVTFKGLTEPRTLVISKECATSSGAALQAAFGSPQGQGPIVAEIRLVANQRQLVFVTGIGSKIVAGEQPDGHFQGTSTSKNGKANEVTIVRISEAELKRIAQPTSAPPPASQ